MISLSGLSAAYPGYLQAASSDTQTKLRQAELQNAQTELAGQAAFGNTLKMLQIPGAQPMPTGSTVAQMQPAQAPSPGQPSIPNRIFSGNEASPLDTAQWPSGPIAPQAAPQGAVAPQAPQGGMPPQQGGMGLGAGGGALTWQQVLNKVVQANPGAPPQVLASAVNRFLPLMNQQAQMEWKQMMLSLQGERVRQGGERIDLARDKEGRIAEGQEQRLGQGERRLNIAEGAEKRRTEQGEKRIEQGQGRLDLAREREARLVAASSVRQDQQWQRLEMQRQNLERQITQGGQRQKLAEWRAAVDAQHKRATEIINSYSINNNLKPNERKALLKEQDDFYRSQLEAMRSAAGSSTPSGGTPLPRGQKTQEKVPNKVPTYNMETGKVE